MPTTMTTAHDLNAEATIISSIIAEPKLFYKISSRMKNINLFLDNKHKAMWKTIVALNEENKIIDLVSILNHIEKNNLYPTSLGAYLNEVSDLVYASDLKHVNGYIDILSEQLRIRNMETMGKKLVMVTKTKTTFDKVKEVLVNYNVLAINTNDDNEFKPKSVTQIINETNKESEDAIAAGKPRLRGIKTGFTSLDRFVRFRAQNCYCIAGRPALGKFLTLTSSIVTPYGKTDNGDMKIGTEIMGSDGNINKVTGVFPQGKKDVWRITFDDDTFVDAGKTHLWTVQSRADRKAAYGKYGSHKERVITTEEISKQVYIDNDKRKNYTINFCKPLKFHKQNITLNPYLLGAYLGDGCYSGNTIFFCNTEHDVITKFNDNLPGECYISDKSNGVSWHTNKSTELRNYLDDLGLKHKKSYEKFIPKNYLYNTIEIRTELLRGLIDTDGHVVSSIYTEKTNNIEYSTTSEQLKDDICDLVRGLGGRATWIKRIGKFTYKGETHISRINYRIWINFADGIIPVSSEKHLKRYIAKKQFFKKFIIKVEKLDYQEEMQCISTDAPDELYITDGYTLTHNTSLALQMALNIAMQGYRVAFFSLEMSEEEIVEKLISMTANITNDDFRALSESEQIIYRKNLKKFMREKADGLIVDYYSVEISEIINSIYALHREKELDIVFIDYLQLIEINSKTDNRNQEITTISRRLKTRVAKKLRIPVVELSQLSRGVESRKDRRPMLSDLRESGSIEQDMTMVMFVYRDEMYEIKLDPKGRSTIDIAELWIKKNRFGPNGFQRMRFTKKYTTFGDLVGG